MNLRQLECFVAVVDEGSFTRAARAIGIALTPAGRSLLPEARAAVRAVERGRRGALAALALETGELEIATVLSMAVGLLPRYIRIWRERYPDIGIRLHEFRHRSLLEDAVEQGVADFAIGPPPVRRWDGPLTVIAWEEFVIVVPPNDPLAGRSSIRLEELADREWVLYHQDHGLAGILEETCRRAGFTPRGSVRTSQAEGAARLEFAGASGRTVAGKTASFTLSIRAMIAGASVRSSETGAVSFVDRRAHFYK